MKVRVESSLSAAGDSPTLTSFVLKLASTMPGGAPHVRAIFKEASVPDYLESVRQTAACVDAGVTDDIKVFNNIGQAVSADCLSQVTGEGDKLHKVLKGVVERLNSGKSRKRRVKTFHIGQTLVFLNILALISDTKLGTIPEDMVHNGSFPYDPDDIDKLNNWLKGGGKKLTFDVTGKPSLVQEGHTLVQTLSLMQLFSIPGAIGKAAGCFEDDELRSWRQAADSFFECYAKWAMKTEDFSQPPKDAKLPIELEQLFYETQQSDPGRLHKVLVTVVELAISEEEGSPKWKREKKRLFQNLRFVLVRHATLKAWMKDPNPISLKWTVNEVKQGCCWCG